MKWSFETNTGVLLIGPLGTNLNEILIEKKVFIQENAFENTYIVCQMAAIFISALSCLIITRSLCGAKRQPQCVNGVSALAKMLASHEDNLELTGPKIVRWYIEKHKAQI